MIIEALLDFIEAGFNFIMGLFPSGVFDPFASLADALGGVLSGVNYWFPLAELLALFVGFVAVMVPLAGVNLVVWLVALIRGGSSRG